ncbi:Transposon Tf2-2 polyprotein [Vitis vinifera]|uniref:Transposon Tf2-2 polyprotein n=1 Tax=Vitis vinifera TaxID=29760 RepID=A0A438HJR6_VITVI|nr:Transposon Tf2-2 polyprotein [Vitis vinifera]
MGGCFSDVRGGKQAVGVGLTGPSLPPMPTSDAALNDAVDDFFRARGIQPLFTQLEVLSLSSSNLHDRDIISKACIFTRVFIVQYSFAVLLGQRIDGHQAQPLLIPGSTPHDSTTPPPGPSGPTIQQDYIVPPPPVQSAPQAGAFVLHGRTETTPHSVVAPAQIVDDTQARIDRIEQRMRSLHVSDGIMSWDGYDDLPVAALPVEFRMPNIERYTGIRCPRIHLQLYSTVMRGHRLDEAQMIMLFPLSLSGAAQRWFASLDPSRHRTWVDLGQEFIRQYSFNTVVDVSRRELEALRQGPDESITSFISRWREKIAQIIDRPSECDQITMIMRSLHPALLGISWASLRQTLAHSSHSNSKGKKPRSGPRSSDVGTIGMTGHRSAHRPLFQSQFLGTPYQMIQHDRYRPVAPIRPTGTTYLHPPPQPVYATQAPQRPPMQFHHQYRALPPPRSVRQFTQLGMPLSRAFQRLRAGHDTDSCSALRHAIQDLIDQGLVDLGRSGVATDPLPTHDTRAVPPPPEGVHLIEFTRDEISMMGWDGEAPQPISLYEESDFVGYIPRQQIPRPFSLTPDKIYGLPPISPIVTRSGRVAQPPPVDRPFAGIAAREEVQREDDEILRQLRTTQARISIWSLLASSSTHRDALVRALGQIRVDTATTPEGLIHMLKADRATCIGRRVSSVLLDNGSALNICPLVTAIALGFSQADFRASTQTVRAYDGTQRTVMGTLSTHVMIGPVSYSIVFQVLRIQSSFNLLLGRPWIHEAGVIPSSLHQKVKFIHEGRIITIQSDRDIITSSEPVLHISHSENDLHLTGFTFDEVQVVSLENGSRDMVPMSFDQHSSTLVLNMMRGMSYLPGMDWVAASRGPTSLLSQLITTHPMDWVTSPQRLMHVIWHDCAGIEGSEHTPRIEGTVRIPETVEIQDIQQALGRIIDAAPRGPTWPHTAFDMFGVSVLETDEDDSIPDAYTNDMDFIGIGRILDVAHAGPIMLLTYLEFSYLMMSQSLMSLLLIVLLLRERPTLWTRLFLLTPCPALTTHIYDVDDVGDTDDPLGGQSKCDSDTEDEKVTPISGSTELIDFGAPDEPREIRIGSSLSLDERSRLIDLLRSYLDVFAWSYEDMSGLDPSIVKEEIRKQLGVGFLSVVEYPEWLANVVPVPKKDGKVRVCVDFRDLNKASPKDDFPLPHIDMLVDSTVGHPMLSFMDGFFWNVGATYQRAATTLFHDMMHTDVEVYVDDMIVKSRDRTDHLAALQRFFERIRQFRLRLNPKKCTFGVASGKLLGHIVSERGIEIDLEKIRAILDMPAPRTEKEIRGFLGRLQYISRFIARLTDICEPIFRLLRKNQPTIWSDDCQRAFERIKECLISPPVLVPPTPGRPLLLYLSVSNMALGCILRHYMTEYSVLLVSRLDPLRYLFDKPVLTEVNKRKHCCRSSSFLSISDDRSVDDDFPDEHLGDHIPRSVQLAFFDHHRLTNNIVEYEACITGLETALDLGIRQLEIHGDSQFGYIHLPRAENQFANALATLASMIVIPAGVTVRPLLIEARGEVDTLIQEYDIQHHKSSAYRPQTNEAVEAINKNIREF